MTDHVWKTGWNVTECVGCGLLDHQVPSHGKCAGAPQQGEPFDPLDGRGVFAWNEQRQCHERITAVVMP